MFVYMNRFNTLFAKTESWWFRCIVNTITRQNILLYFLSLNIVQEKKKEGVDLKLPLSFYFEWNIWLDAKCG